MSHAPLELAEALRRLAGVVLAEEVGTQRAADALLVMRHADTIDRPCTQTAIVHHAPGRTAPRAPVRGPCACRRVAVDDRVGIPGTWRPIPAERIDVRHE